MRASAVPVGKTVETQIVKKMSIQQWKSLHAVKQLSLAFTIEHRI